MKEDVFLWGFSGMLAGSKGQPHMTWKMAKAAK